MLLFNCLDVEKLFTLKYPDKVSDKSHPTVLHISYSATFPKMGIRSWGLVLTIHTKTHSRSKTYIWLGVKAHHSNTRSETALLLYHEDLHRFCEGNHTSLYRQWSKPQACLTITPGSLKIIGLCTMWVPMAARGHQAIMGNRPSVIYLPDKPDCHSSKKKNAREWMEWHKKGFMYLIGTGFRVMSSDQPLEFFIYLNEIWRVVTYIHVVEIPSHWT